MRRISFDTIIRAYHLTDEKFADNEPSEWLRSVYIPFVMGSLKSTKDPNSKTELEINGARKGAYTAEKYAKDLIKLERTGWLYKKTDENERKEWTTLFFRNFDRDGGIVSLLRQSVPRGVKEWFFLKAGPLSPDPATWGELIYKGGVENPADLIDPAGYYLYEKDDRRYSLPEALRLLRVYAFKPFEVGYTIFNVEHDGVILWKNPVYRRIRFDNIRVPALDPDQAIEILALYLRGVDMKRDDEGELGSKAVLEELPDLKALIEESDGKADIRRDFLSLPYDYEKGGYASKPRLPKDPKLAIAVFAEYAAFEALPLRGFEPVSKTPITVIRPNAI